MYVWDHACGFLNGIVMGKTYVEFNGEVKIKCKNNNYETVINFK